MGTLTNTTPATGQEFNDHWTECNFNPPWNICASYYLFRYGKIAFSIILQCRRWQNKNSPLKHNAFLMFFQITNLITKAGILRKNITCSILMLPRRQSSGEVFSYVASSIGEACDAAGPLWHSSFILVKIEMVSWEQQNRYWVESGNMSFHRKYYLFFVGRLSCRGSARSLRHKISANT